MVTEEEFRERLTELSHKFGVPGASAALLSDGNVISAVTGTLNSATGAPVLPQTLFAAGSVTKVFTSSLVMTLVDEGQLDLDTPVHTYLQDFTLADPDRAAVITPRMLLNHSSGMPGNYMPDLPPGDDVLERLMQDLRTMPVIGDPGHMWSYSNMGMSTLGRIVEVLTGQTYELALKARILEPLGVNAASDAEELLLHSTAIGHIIDPVAGTVSPTPRLRLGPENGPAGSRLWLDADALIALGQMHIDGKSRDGRQILSRDALREMQTPQYDDFLPFHVFNNFGLGWGIYRGGDDPVLVHTGANLGMHSSLYAIPRQGVVLGVLTNGANGHLMLAEFTTALLEENFGVKGFTPAGEALKETEIDREAFIGTYESVDGKISVEDHDGKLHVKIIPNDHFAVWNKLMDPGKEVRAIPLRCIDPDRPRFMLGAGEIETGVPVEFYNPDADGRPTLIRVGILYERRTA
ncbi:serine hydrolase domain-containing protein [Streptomyces chartreusis]